LSSAWLQPATSLPFIRAILPSATTKEDAGLTPESPFCPIQVEGRVGPFFPWGLVLGFVVSRTNSSKLISVGTRVSFRCRSSRFSLFTRSQSIFLFIGFPVRKLAAWNAGRTAWDFDGARLIHNVPPTCHLCAAGCLLEWRTSGSGAILWDAAAS
jgi:hypothetical protein